MEEVKFSNEQINAIEKMMYDDVKPLIEKEIKDNYIPKLLITEMLKEVTKKKESTTDTAKKIYIDGCIWILNSILNWGD